MDYAKAFKEFYRFVATSKKHKWIEKVADAAENKLSKHIETISDDGHILRIHDFQTDEAFKIDLGGRLADVFNKKVDQEIEVVVDNVNAPNVDLVFPGGYLIYNKIVIKGCTLGSIHPGEHTKIITLAGSTIHLLEITHPTMMLRMEQLTDTVLRINGKHDNVDINNCNFNRIEIHNPADLKIYTLNFDDQSSIEEDAFNAYKVLHYIAKESHDPILSQVLYIKKLGEYVKNNHSWDDKLLFCVGQLTNKGGLSVVQPVILLFTFNLVFLLLISKFGTADLDTSFLYNMWNINPLDDLKNAGVVIKLDNTQQAWDGLRRVVLAILIYQTIISAKRFAHRI